MKLLYVIILLNILYVRCVKEEEYSYDEDYDEDNEDESEKDDGEPSSPNVKLENERLSLNTRYESERSPSSDNEETSPPSDNSKPYYDVNQAEELFENFVKKYNKSYKDERDREEHFDAFVKSLKFINMANQKSDSATFDINRLSDYTQKDRASLFGSVLGK